MGGIIDGIKIGILLQLGIAVVLPAVMPMLGHLTSGLQGGGQQQPQGRRPYGEEY